MSGICGILHLDGQPADPGLLDIMMDAMSYYGPDGESRWINGPVAMGYVARAHAAPGTRVQLVVRGKPLPAEVVPLPFAPHHYVRK